MARHVITAGGLLLILACGGTGTPPEPEPAVERQIPVRRPPGITLRMLGEVEVNEAVYLRLRAAESFIQTCLHDQRGNLPGAGEPVAMSADVHIVKVGAEVTMEVTRSGMDAPDVVDTCVVGPLAKRDLEGLGDVDVTIQVVADFD